jgi:hypothetical protein
MQEHCYFKQIEGRFKNMKLFLLYNLSNLKQISAIPTKELKNILDELKKYNKKTSENTIIKAIENELNRR